MYFGLCQILNLVYKAQIAGILGTDGKVCLPLFGQRRFIGNSVQEKGLASKQMRIFTDGLRANRSQLPMDVDRLSLQKALATQGRFDGLSLHKL